MGYAPDWNKGSMKKSGATPVKHGVVSRELFHGAKKVQNFYDGGSVENPNPSGSDMKYAPVPDTSELNIRGDKVGYYTGNDEVVKYRMNMTDDVGGKSLRYKDNPDSQPMPEKREYDSIEAILEAKGAGKKAEDKDLVGDVVRAVKDAGKPNATNAKASAPKVKPKSPGMGDSFSDDSRSPDQVAPSRPVLFSDDARSPDQVSPPSRKMLNEAAGNDEYLRPPAKERKANNVDKNNRVRFSGRDELSTNLSAKNPELAKKLNMYYGKK